MYIFCDSWKSNLGRERRQGNGRVDWQRIGNAQGFRQIVVHDFCWQTVQYSVVRAHILQFGSTVLPRMLYSR